MKKSTLGIIAILLFIAISCTKENNNRIRHTPSELFVNVVPHLDTSSIVTTNPPINGLYKAEFDNYSEFEAQISGSITERGLIWNDTDGGITLGRGVSDTSTTVVPTVNNPYIPTAINLFKGPPGVFVLYFFRYYAKLNNGDIVYSQSAQYIYW